MARAYLMGRLRFEGPDSAFDERSLPGQQGRVVFAALVTERTPVARGELADRIWADELPSQWNGALSAIVSKIRGLVADAGLDGHDVVQSGGGTYAISLPAGSWVDAEDALRRLDRAEGALRQERLDLAVSEATVASSILQRPFLPGIASLWGERVRAEYEKARYRAHVVLADGWIRRGSYPLAAVIAEAAVTLDPYREVGHRLLMQAERGRGDVSAALRAFERCRSLMERELGSAPSAETRAVADSIRTS